MTQLFGTLVWHTAVTLSTHVPAALLVEISPREVGSTFAQIWKCNMFSDILHNYPKLETSQMPLIRQADKQTALCPCKAIEW